MSNTRLRLTLSQKIEILDQFAMGNTNQIELGKWAQQKFDLIKPLSQQTVSNILSNADQLYSNIVAIKNSKSLKLPKYPQLDEEVEKFVSHMNDCSIPVNRACIIEYVKRIARSKYSITEDITFSDGWLSKVFKRLGLKCRPTHGECASVDVNSKSIQDHLEKIREELTDYPLADIMNFDETGLYYNQPPRRTICSQPLGVLKKSKTRVTVGLLCNADGTYKGHPIVIGQFKSPSCFEENPKMLSMTAIGTRRYVEYHHSPKAWMTTEIFSAYVKKLDIAFGREGRKVALLLDNASVHKLKFKPVNIKLVFLPANTTSMLQALDAGIIANFKAYFRSQQYLRSLDLFASKQLDNLDVYNMNQVQAMFFLANAWLKVTPATIKNCWRHTNILGFKENPTALALPPTVPLPLEDNVVQEINNLLPDLPGNLDNEVTDVSQLDLDSDEMFIIDDEEIVMDGEEEIPMIPEQEIYVDINDCKKRLREAYETILALDVPLDDLDNQYHRRVRMRLAESRAEVENLKEQADIRRFFQ
ncbi:hypothetical protein INT47_006476 [Mucor saturninus]|uniref:HTH CENPB-type domain-containing protein n=1 Tax=Mucor saturninus TaxID=64648 RepID=A0A8H7UP72_9FUNG|nr:hypothetical protein INT47_006476 [Mucor saturninus]